MIYLLVVRAVLFLLSVGLLAVVIYAVYQLWLDSEEAKAARTRAAGVKHRRVS
jgi:hypothetical protein